jgi:hypothetical protein
MNPDVVGDRRGRSNMTGSPTLKLSNVAKAWPWTNDGFTAAIPAKATKVLQFMGSIGLTFLQTDPASSAPHAVLAEVAPRPTAAKTFLSLPIASG